MLISRWFSSTAACACVLLLIQIIPRGVFDVDTLDTLTLTALAGSFAIALDLATFAFITDRHAVAVSQSLGLTSERGVDGDITRP